MSRMDSDGNGSLSQEEFVQGVLQVTWQNVAQLFPASFTSIQLLPIFTVSQSHIDPVQLGITGVQCMGHHDGEVLSRRRS